MSEYFALDGGYCAAEVRMHSNGIYGTGGDEHAVLVACLDLTFRGPIQAGRCYDFRELRCRLSPFDSSYVATSLPAHLDLRLATGKGLSSHMAILEIPIDRARLAAIDRLRKGGDVLFQLALELFVDEWVEVARVQDHNNPAVQGVVAVSDAAQLEKIKAEAAGITNLKDKLKYWDDTDVLEVHEALESVNEAINSLGLVPQGF
jgi:hypothetical protein